MLRLSQTLFNDSDFLRDSLTDDFVVPAIDDACLDGLMTRDIFDKVLGKYRLDLFENDYVSVALFETCKLVGEGVLTPEEGQKNLDNIRVGEWNEWDQEVAQIISALKFMVLKSKLWWVPDFEKHDKCFSSRLEVCAVFIKILTKTEGEVLDKVVTRVQYCIKDVFFLIPECERKYENLYEYAHHMTTDIMRDNPYISLRPGKEKASKSRTYVYPSSKALAQIKGSLDKIGKRFPRLSPPDFNNLESLGLPRSFANKGKTVFTPETLEAASLCGLVKYSINKEYLAYVVKNKKAILEPLRDFSFEDYEGFQIKHACMLIHKKVKKYKDILGLLGMALAYKNVAYFYYDIKCDWRGRFYSVGDTINYQGTKMGLALIQFYKPGVFRLADLDSLKIYGANLYGFKGSFSALIEKFDFIEMDVIKLDPTLIKLSKEPELFTAFALEYQRLIYEGPGAETRFPILVDCTCSGLQHLAAMIASAPMGLKVNLIGGLLEPQDIYTSILDAVVEKFKAGGVQLTRKQVKPCIMTIPYNATVYGMSNAIAGSMFYKEKKYYASSDFSGPGVNHKFIYNLASNIKDTFFTLHPELKALVVYFKEIAALLTDLDMPISWVTPQGVYIEQDNRISTPKQIKGYARRPISLKIPTAYRCKKRQQAGLMPNIVHSLDAENVSRTIRLCKDTDILTIHDCFGTTLDNIKNLQESVRFGFVGIYLNQTFINQFHLKCKSDISHIHKIEHDNLVLNGFTGSTHKIPKPPELGSLDIASIKNAIYMVA